MLNFMRANVKLSVSSKFSVKSHRMKIIKIIFCISYLTCLLLIHFNDSKSTVDIFMKSMKVTTDPNYIKVRKCGFKTSRQIPTGLISCSGYLLKQLDYGYLQVTLYYKYGTIYRQYLIHYKKIEICEFMKKERSVKYTNVLVDYSRKVISKCCPQFDHECPFLPRFYNGSKIDINGTVSPLLPPVVPAGMIFISTDGCDSLNQ